MPYSTKPSLKAARSLLLLPFLLLPAGCDDVPAAPAGRTPVTGQNNQASGSEGWDDTAWNTTPWNDAGSELGDTGAAPVNAGDGWDEGSQAPLNPATGWDDGGSSSSSSDSGQSSSPDSGSSDSGGSDGSSSDGWD